MKTLVIGSVLLILLNACSTIKDQKNDNGWIDLFDGKSLDGWRASENPATFAVENGRAQKHLSSGTFALQGHDPASKVFFKEVKVKVL